MAETRKQDRGPMAEITPDKREHVMQHTEPPTWCIHCGTFDVYCAHVLCKGEKGEYDSRNPEVFKRMLTELIGAEDTQ